MFVREGLYWIRNKSVPDRFIDVRSKPFVNGGIRASTPIGIFSPRLTRSQLWILEGCQDGESIILRNYDDGTVLGVVHPFAIVGPYEDTGDDANPQHWQITWVRNDSKIPYYRITNQKTQNVLTQTLHTHNRADFSIELKSFGNDDAQLWSFDQVTFPTMYQIVNTSTQLCLQYRENPGRLATLDISTKVPSRSQLWYLESVEEGYYMVRLVESEDRVLDLSGGDNETILAWSESGSENQKWKITDVNMNGVVSIVSARGNTVLYAKRGREIYKPHGATNAETFGDTYQWRLVPCPVPSLFWTNLQCRGSGKFVTQATSGRITASDGAQGEIDLTTQWRFLTHDHETHFSIVNRQSGNFLYNASGSSLAADKNATSNKYFWVLGAAGQDYSVTNVASSRVVTYVDGEIQAANVAATEENQQWFINEALQSVPSFALINGKTGMALTYVSGVTSGSVVMGTAFNSYRCQWIVQQVGTDEHDEPTFIIINKLSDKVLDHWHGVSIEALSDGPNHRNHQWKLRPCHKRYFTLVNVATGKLLYDEGGVPGDGYEQGNTMTDHDRRCCWTFVSRRDGIYDTIVLDSDILYPQQNSHHIVKRAAKKGPKGKGKSKAEPSHIPDNPRITRITNASLRAVFERLIGQLDFASITGQAARTLASTSRREVVNQWRIAVDRSMQDGWDREGWVRIDLQGTYNDQNGVRVANIQGQHNSDTVFHVIIPIGVAFGVEVIQNAMRESLESAEPVRLDVPDNATAGGSKKPPTTTPRPPGPGAPPAGQFWAASALQLAGIAIISLGVL